MKKTALITLTTFFSAFTTAAPVGLYLNFDSWQSNANGLVGENNSLAEYNFNKQRQTNYSVAVVHPVNLLPNVRIAKSTLANTATQLLSQDMSFAGANFSNGATIVSTVSAEYLDYSLYGQLFDNGALSVDLGLTARKFSAKAQIREKSAGGNSDANSDSAATDNTTTGTTTGTTTTVAVNASGTSATAKTSSTTTTTTTASGEAATSDNSAGAIKLSETVPMLYLATQMNSAQPKLTWFTVSNMSLKNHYRLYDHQLGLNYQLNDNFIASYKLTLGYRMAKVALDKVEKLSTEVKYKGPFIGLSGRF